MTRDELCGSVGALLGSVVGHAAQLLGVETARELVQTFATDPDFWEALTAGEAAAREHPGELAAFLDARDQALLDQVRRFRRPLLRIVPSESDDGAAR